MLTTRSTPDEIIKYGFSQFSEHAPEIIRDRVAKDAATIDSYEALVDRLDGPGHLAGNLAHRAAGGVMYGILEKFGIDPNEWKLTVSPIEIGKVKYGPEEYESARKFLGSWTKIAEVSLLIATTAALSVAVIGTVLAGAALTAVSSALAAGTGLEGVTTALNVAKFRGIKWLSIPAAIATIATGVAFFANTQISATGDLETYVKQGVARGQEAIAKTTQLSGGGYAGGFTNNGPRTIIRMVEEKKPKQFLGTLFSAKLGKIEEFDRQLDDEITDMNDLKTDAKLNLNKWLKTLPGRMGYSIVVRKDPVDEFGVQQSGIWATLTMHITRQSGAIVPIDTILLGPITAEARLELVKQQKTIESQIPKELTAQEIREIQMPNGIYDIFNTQGERVFASGDNAPASSSEVKSNPKPSLPSGTLQPNSGESFSDYKARASAQGASSIGGQDDFDTYQGKTPAAPVVNTPQGSSSSSSTLRVGSKGETVKELQKFLNGRGENLVVDGNFGYLTEGAVMRFQAAYGLKADGIVGPQTLTKIQSVKFGAGSAALVG